MEGDTQAGTPRGDGTPRTAGAQSWSQVQDLCWDPASALGHSDKSHCAPSARGGTEPHRDRTRRGTHRGGSRTEGQHVTWTHRTRGSWGSCCCHDPPGTAGGSSWETPKSTHAEGPEPGWAPGRAVPRPGLGHRPPVELLGPGWGAAGPQRDRKGAYGTLDGSWSEGWSGGHGSMRDGLGRARRRGWSGVNVWGGELGNIWGGQQKHRTPINAGRGQRGDRAQRGDPRQGRP